MENCTVHVWMYPISEKAIISVTITSSRPFNGIGVTGLYSAANVERDIHPLAFAMPGTGEL